VPDVILVRKSYEEKRRRRQRHARAWKLKRLDMEVEGER
jgi:nonsense-mediated mRNA decay protein 3